MPAREKEPMRLHGRRPRLCDYERDYEETTVRPPFMSVFAAFTTGTGNVSLTLTLISTCISLIVVLEKAIIQERGSRYV